MEFKKIKLFQEILMEASLSGDFVKNPIKNYEGVCVCDPLHLEHCAR